MIQIVLREFWSKRLRYVCDQNVTCVTACEYACKKLKQCTHMNKLTLSSHFYVQLHINTLKCEFNLTTFLLFATCVTKKSELEH